MSVQLAQTVDIFVVDDNRLIGETLGIILRQVGYTVHVFADPGGAFEGLVMCPALLISDHQMPLISGCELATRAYTQTPSTKIIVFSGSLTAQDEEWRLLKQLCSDARLLSKPMYPTELLASVTAMIGAPTPHREIATSIEVPRGGRRRFLLERIEVARGNSM